MNLSGTVWESGYFEGSCESPNYHPTGSSTLIVKCDKLTIFFSDADTGNDALISAKNLTFIDSELDLEYSGDINPHTSYTCNGDNITVKVYYSVLTIIDAEENWTGKVEKNKMTLTNVFGAAVEFRKK